MSHSKPKDRQKSEIEKAALEYAIAKRAEQSAKASLDHLETLYKVAERAADVALEKLEKLAGEVV